MAEKEEAEKERPSLTSNFSSFVDSLISLSKLALFIMLATFAGLHWSYFADWATSINHAEIFGIKLDREEAEKHIRAFEGHEGGFNRDTFNAAIKEAELLAPSIQDAKIVWVDPHPENNKEERELLQELGVQVQVLWSTDQLIKFLSLSDKMPDLIISNMMRSGPDNPTAPLKKCPAVYVDFPSEKIAKDSNSNIWEFNANTQKNPPGGLSMSEILATNFSEAFGDSQRQRIIFYSASSGGRLFGSCFKISTNRPDVLLHHVVETLASERWSLLKRYTLSNERRNCQRGKGNTCIK